MMFRSPKLLAMAKDAPVCFGCQRTNTGDVVAATQATVAGICNPAGPTWRYRPHDKLDAALNGKLLPEPDAAVAKHA